MKTEPSAFNRILLCILATLYVITLAAFLYPEWSANPDHLWWMTLLNALILTIPLALLYGSIYVLALAWREHTRQGRVGPRLAKTVHWAPRLAAILIIFFTSLFSLDVFEMDAPPLELLGGFLMHNIPSIVMILLLVFAWKRPVVGFVSFLIAAAAFVIFFVRSLDALPSLLLFVAPILLIAFLFYADWKWLEPATPARIDLAA